MATHNSVVAIASHYSCSCCLSSPSMIPLLPPPSTSSSSSTGHTCRYCFSLPSRTPSCCSTHLSLLHYTSLVTPSHALLYRAPALSRDLLCRSHLPPLPLCLHRGRRYDAVGTHWEIVRSSPKVIGACRELSGSSPKVIGGLSGVHRELTEGNQEIVRSSLKVIMSLSGVRREFTIR
ncbi:hypothetical protein BHE74_00027430 [Ensete ventricosum]|nr:hypothetical protein GW17_00014144 [Ensete ventricosum]RWW65269.1 hypothetical protein BHE74_00027430 [Ensete ventricosum]RZS14973.1 hypothetical protein BHM03_00046740 [Ensete ventricosum]